MSDVDQNLTELKRIRPGFIHFSFAFALLLTYESSPLFHTFHFPRSLLPAHHIHLSQDASVCDHAEEVASGSQVVNCHLLLGRVTPRKTLCFCSTPDSTKSSLHTAQEKRVFLAMPPQSGTKFALFKRTTRLLQALPPGNPPTRYCPTIPRNDLEKLRTLSKFLLLNMPTKPATITVASATSTGHPIKISATRASNAARKGQSKGKKAQ